MKYSKLPKKLYKVLAPGRKSCNGGSGIWPEPGKWHSVPGRIQCCSNGLHVTDEDRVDRWVRSSNVNCDGSLIQSREVWEVKVHPRAKISADGSKFAVSKAMLTRLVATVTATSYRRAAKKLSAAKAAADKIVDKASAKLSQEIAVLDGTLRASRDAKNASIKAVRLAGEAEIDKIEKQHATDIQKTVKARERLSREHYIVRQAAQSKIKLPTLLGILRKGRRR